MQQRTDQSSHMAIVNLAELNVLVPRGMCVEGIGAKESNVDGAHE